MDLYLSFEINGSCLPFCFKNTNPYVTAEILSTSSTCPNLWGEIFIALLAKFRLVACKDSFLSFAKVHIKSNQDRSQHWLGLMDEAREGIIL